MSVLQLVFVISVKREDYQNKFKMYIFIRIILFVCVWVCVHMCARISNIGLHFGVLVAQENEKDTFVCDHICSIINWFMVIIQ